MLAKRGRLRENSPEVQRARRAARIRAAIHKAAKKHDEFTAHDVWAELKPGDAAKFNPGGAGVFLRLEAKAGRIMPTGMRRKNMRPGMNGGSLMVWKSLL